MTGSGKSEVADKFVKKGFEYLRFGQITLDEVKKRGLEPKEENERLIREEFRRKYGQAAFAILNMPKIEEILSNGKDVLIDGLYSWAEYKELKNKYGDQLIVIAIYAPPKTRYQRLKDRRSRYKDDPKMKYRSFSKEETKSRDYAEIENLDKGGPIAMANFTIENTGTLKELDERVDGVLGKIEGGKNA